MIPGVVCAALMQKALGKVPHALISLVLAGSGFAALIDEHLLSKLLVRVVGSSAEAVAVVLVALMGGMSLGAWLTKGVVARLRRPLFIYAMVELAIGAFALALPLLTSLVSLAFVSLARSLGASMALGVLRFVASVLVASLPGLFMGATMPLLFEGAQRIPNASPLPYERYYASNTFGAALGVLLSTYVFVERFGIRGTLAVAAAANFAVAAVALHLSRRAEASSAGARADVAAEPPTIPLRLALGLAFGSGMLAFLLETLWFRILAVVVGSSVYAFGVMLFAFLVSNAVGSGLIARRRGAGIGTFGAAQAAVGLFTLLSVPLFDDIPTLFRAAGRYVPSFTLWEATRFVGAALPLVLPCAFMGAAFALLLRLGGGDDAQTSGRVARIYAVNTLGAMLGTLLGTFALAPALGSQRALIVAGVSEMALAAVALSLLGAPRGRGWAAGIAVAAASLTLIAHRPWDIARLLSGSNVYFQEGFQEFDRLRFLEEDRAGGVVAVLERAGTRTLIANGKFEGNDGFEVPDQQMYALLPMLFVKRHDAAANIGVGTANSLATMAAFPFRRLDAVDLSAGILRAARREFAHLNGGVLDAPQVRVHVDDGRNFLLTSRTRYDLIQTQLSSIWIAGSAELYNREFYETAAAALAPGGVFQQWVQLHHMQSVDMARVLHTTRVVFPHVLLFVGGHQGVLVASREPLRADAAQLRGWSASPSIQRALRSSGLEHPYAAFGHLYLDVRGVDRYIEEVAATEHVDPEALLSTDDRPRLEYSTPRGNLLRDAVEDNMERLRRHSAVSLRRFVTNVRDEYDLRLLLAYASRERGYGRIAAIELAPVLERARREGHTVLTEALSDPARLQWP